MKNTSLTIIASSALAVVMAVAPAAAFAKSDKGQAELHGRAEAQASTTAKISCPKAFGHLFAPGWVKKNGTQEFNTACKIPFGVAWKMSLFQHPKPGTTTPDTTAPTISLITSSTSTTTAIVMWNTNERSDSQIAYGTTTAYGATTTLNTSLGLFHTVTITGLTSGTTYHFQVLSRDASGNLKVSSDGTFVTTTLPDTTSPTLGAASVSNVSSTTATVAWTTNEPSTSKVYYAAGSSLNLGTASSVSSAALLSNHSLIVSGLSASTTYSYAVQSQDAFGNTSTSATSSFSTTL